MDLVEAAREWLDVPFHHQGRNRVGIDCAGLVIVCAKELGIEFEDIKGYARTPDGVTLERELDRQLTKVKREPISGDVLLMRIRREPQHIAIKTDIGIIHAYQGAGKVVEHNLDDKWRKRIKGVYSLG